MGRKPAPQPLTLAQETPSNHHQHHQHHHHHRRDNSNPPIAQAQPGPAYQHNRHPSHSASPGLTSLAANIDSFSSSATPRTVFGASPMSTNLPHQQPQPSQSDTHRRHPSPRSNGKAPTRDLVDNSNPSSPGSLTTTDQLDLTATTSSEGAARLQSRFNPAFAQAAGNQSNKGGGSFFHFNKGVKSFPNVAAHAHQKSDSSRSQPMSRGSDGTALSRPGDHSPTDSALQAELPLQPSQSDVSLTSSVVVEDPAPASASAPAPTPAPVVSKTKGRTKTFGLLGGKRSQKARENDDPSSHGEGNRLPLNLTGLSPEDQSTSPLTAPLGQDRSFRHMMDSTVRNRSADRGPPSRDNASGKDHSRDRSFAPLPGHRDGAGSGFFSGLKSSGSKAAGAFGNRFFGKTTRSGSTNEREHLEDEHYTIKTLNLPLVEQTRKTRLSRRLKYSRDKTEFWMPAFPWRAIDYLNYKGCDVEGLYRVPGSGPQIKKWQRRFDEEYDVNLFEADDLYDINIIGSMLKAWLRELPDELFPKAAQERIARECSGSETVPQMLIDELSNLPPFNYYLLFAITCHLSLLLAHSDKNKMDFRNLCICFQPCMKIDAFCFKYLVCDWRECWKGCQTEAKYIEEEYRIFDEPPPPIFMEPQEPQEAVNVMESLLTSPTSSVPAPLSVTQEKSADSRDTPPSRQPKPKPQMKPLQLTQSNHSLASNSSSISTQLTNASDREGKKEAGEREEERKETAEMKRLSPIAPLSPIGF